MFTIVSFGGNAVNIIISATDKTSAVIDGVKGKLGGLGGAMNKLRGPMLAVGAASVGMAAVSVKAFADYETSMAKVNTLLGEGEDASQTYGDVVTKLATTMGVAGGRVEVTAGLYQTISAGIDDTAEATEFLTAATKASVGGSADLETVILAGTKAMASFGLEVSESERVFDVFAGAVVAGQTDMSQLASAFPRVAGSAGEMGLTLEETAGVLAGLTKILPTTEQAATSMDGVLTALLKPTDAMKETLDKLGFASGKAALEQLGFVGTLEAIKDEVGDDTETMGELFGRVEGLRAVFATLGKASESVAKSIKIVGDATGLSNKQFEDMDKTAAQKMIKVQAKFEVLASKIGEALIPLFEKMIPIIEQVVEVFTALDPAIQAGVLIIGTLVGAFALLFPVISWVAGAIGGAGGLGAILTALTNPIGLIILAIGLLAAAWATDFGGIREIVKKVMDKVGPILEKVSKLITRIVDILIEKFGPIVEETFANASSAIELAWGFMEPIFNKIIEYVELVIDTFDSLLSALEGDLGPLDKVLGKWLKFFTDLFKDIILAVGNFLIDIFNDFVTGITKVGTWLYGAGQDLVWGLVNGLTSIGWRIWNAIFSFLPSAQDIFDYVFGAISTAGDWLGDFFGGGGNGDNSGGTTYPDFISRPGMGVQAFSPQDTIIGVKDLSDLQNAFGGGGSSTTIYIENVNLSEDYTFDDFKRDLAEDEADDIARRQNR